MACGNPIDTRDQARDLILSSVVDPDTVSGEIMAFLMEAPLEAGAVIEPAGFPDLADTLTEKTWFCWIDDEPSAEFAHLTRYVFIAVRNGRVRIENRDWYPFLNATTALFRDSASLNTTRFLILNTTTR